MVIDAGDAVNISQANIYFSSCFCYCYYCCSCYSCCCWCSSCCCSSCSWYFTCSCSCSPSSCFLLFVIAVTLLHVIFLCLSSFLFVFFSLLFALVLLLPVLAFLVFLVMLFFSFFLFFLLFLLYLFFSCCFLSSSGWFIPAVVVGYSSDHKWSSYRLDFRLVL